MVAMALFTTPTMVISRSARQPQKGALAVRYHPATTLQARFAAIQPQPIARCTF